MAHHENYFKPYRQRIQEVYNHHHKSPDHDSLQHYQYHQSPKKQNFYDYYKELATKSPRTRRERTPEKERVNYSFNYQKDYHYKKDKQSKAGRLMHEPIWDHLYNKGLQSRSRILQMHENKKNRIDYQCTFQPATKKNSRYMLPSKSNFFQRNTIWYENRIEKIVKEKQDEVTKDLEGCTFRPKINKNYKFKKNKQSMTPSKSVNNIHRTHRSPYQPKSAEKKENQMSKQEVGKIKNLIRKELNRIQL